jgi:hypothetical protein
MNLTGLGRRKRQDILLNKRVSAKEFVLKKKQDWPSNRDNRKKFKLLNRLALLRN